MFDINLLNHDFIWNKSYNGIGLEFKCSKCSIIAHSGLMSVITFVNEKRFVQDRNLTCDEYLVKKLLE